MRFRRLRCEGGRYFFTAVTLDRRPILIDNIDRLQAAFSIAAQNQPFDLEAIVVLPDHLHTMWRLPLGDSDFSGRWNRIKQHFSRGIPFDSSGPSRERKRERGVWQRRFWEHLIRDDEDWRRHLDYVHRNPVKHGYCTDPAEWPHSSFHRYVSAGIYPGGWGRTAEPSEDTIRGE